MIPLTPSQGIPTFFRVRNALDSVIGRISQAGHLHKPTRRIINPMRILGSYAIVYIYDGEGYYDDANGLKQPIAAGDLILVFPDVAHGYGPDDRGWREVYFVFDGPMFDLWRKAGLLDPLQPVHHLEPIEYWLRRLISVLGGLTQEEWSPALLDICRLQQVLAEAVVGGPRGAARQDELRWVSRACALLESAPATQFDLTAVARRMGTSYAAFRRRFVQAAGMPPG